MKLTLEVPIEEAEKKLDYTHQTLFLGSCFSEHIFKKLTYFEFECMSNPMGIMFHPFSIENFLKLVYVNHEFTEADVFEHQGIFKCFDAHSKLTSLQSEDLVNTLNQAVQNTFNWLKKTDFVWISLGTAYVYRHKELNKYVANCHQLPNQLFTKELASVEAIHTSLVRLVSYLRSMQPKIKIGFTVSPVRHSKDGIVQNTLSKAHLHTALHQLLSNDKVVVYFPAYEIFQDELRDYRFYASDLVHPNNLGIEYVWNKFKSNFINESCFALMHKIDRWNKGNLHKSQFTQTKAHQKFLLYQEKLKAEIASKKSLLKQTGEG